MKLFIFASVSCLKRVILLKVLQSQKFSNCYVWLQGSPIFSNGVLYKQTDGVAIAAPLVPSLANEFLSHQKVLWNNCLQRFKLVFLATLHRWYFYTLQIKGSFKVFSRYSKFLAGWHVFFYLNTKREKIIISRSWNYTWTRLQPHFIDNLLLGTYIVTLQVSYILFIN